MHIRFWLVWVLETKKTRSTQNTKKRFEHKNTWNPKKYLKNIPNHPNIPNTYNYLRLLRVPERVSGRTRTWTETRGSKKIRPNRYFSMDPNLNLYFRVDSSSGFRIRAKCPCLLLTFQIYQTNHENFIF